MNAVAVLFFAGRGGAWAGGSGLLVDAAGGGAMTGGATTGDATPFASWRAGISTGIWPGLLGRSIEVDHSFFPGAAAMTRCLPGSIGSGVLIAAPSNGLSSRVMTSPPGGEAT